MRTIPVSVVSVLFFALAAAGQQPTSSALPPGAQAAFESGLHAAGQNQFGLAIRYFTQAQALAPTYPLLLFNLGLAHDKAGHEVAAIAWLEAYLSTAPEAENSLEVRREIERLKSEALAKARRAFQVAIQAAQQLNEDQRSSALDSIAWQWNRVGDIQGLLSTPQLAGKNFNKQAAIQDGWEAFAELCAEEGFPQVALEVLQNLSFAYALDRVWDEISNARINLGDYDGASEAARHITDGQKRADLLGKVKRWRLSQILEMNFELGNLDQVPLEELLSTEGDDAKVNTLLDFAEQEIESRDLAGAQQTINRALKLATGLRGKIWLRASSLSEVALAQMKLGDSPGAKSTAKSLLSLPADDSTVEYRATAKAILGDYKTALKDIRNMPRDPFNPANRDYGFGNIALVQALSGNVKAAKETSRLAAQHNVLFDRSDESIARAYLLRGNFAGALEYARLVSDYPQLVLLQEIMRAAIRAGRLREAEQASSEDAMLVGRLNMMLEVAQAYHRARNDADARRLLAAAQDQALREKKNFFKDSTQRLVDPLKKIAQAQLSLGDENAANRTLNSIPLILWLAYAHMWSGPIWSTEDEAGDTDAVLKKMSHETSWGGPVKTDEIPGNVAWLGGYLGHCVLVTDLLDHVYNRGALPSPL